MRLACLFTILVLVGCESAPIPKTTTLRTYNFTARITKNGGITPFEVGKVIEGQFTYDLSGENQYPQDSPLAKAKQYARYFSEKNEIKFEIGGNKFAGKGKVLVGISMVELLDRTTESFAITGSDLTMPPGWEIGEGPSPDYGLVLDNDPSKKVIKSLDMPATISPKDFATLEFNLQFRDGFKFPGGEVKEAYVKAVVEKLELNK